MVKIILNERQVKYILNNIITEQEGGSAIFNVPGDKNWEYSLIKGKWYAKKIGTDNWIRLSDNIKYGSAVEKLDKQFPNARPNTQIGGIPTKNTPPDSKEVPDFKTELPTPGFKDPNRFIKQ